MESAFKSPLVLLELHESEKYIHTTTGTNTSCMIVEPVSTTIDDTLKNVEI